MMKNFSKLDMSMGFTASPALLKNIKKLQEQPDELFFSDNFIIRLRQDYQTILNQAAGLSTIEYCQLMQQSKIRFVQDFMEAYQTAFEDIVNRYRTRMDDTDFLTNIEKIRDRQIEFYVLMDNENWWSGLMKNQASWPLFAERLYKTNNIAGIEPIDIIKTVTYILLLNSILRGDAEKLGLTLDDSAFHEQKESLKKDEEALMKVKPMKSFRLLVTKPEVADKVLARLHQLIDIKTQPKDIVMPIRAAMDAGAIRRPTWEEFCKEFGNDKISGKSSLSDYTNPEKQPYAGSAFSAMIDEFRKMIL
jgi:hypothetical protein